MLPSRDQAVDRIRGSLIALRERYVSTLWSVETPSPRRKQMQMPTDGIEVRGRAVVRLTLRRHQECSHSHLYQHPLDHPIAGLLLQLEVNSRQPPLQSIQMRPPNLAATRF